MKASCGDFNAVYLLLDCGEERIAVWFLHAVVVGSCTSDMWRRTESHQMNDVIEWFKNLEANFATLPSSFLKTYNIASSIL